MITELLSKAGKTEETCDICIVGSGAAGSELAYCLRDSGLSVIVLESGFLDFNWETQRLCRFNQVGHKIRSANHFKPFGRREARLHELRYRAFGGSLNIWGRRWMMLNSVDFVKRPDVEFTGWPITLDDLDPYYKAILIEYKLHEFLYADEIKTDLQLAFLSCREFRANPFVSQTYCSKLVVNYFGAFERSPSVKVILGANATDIRLSGDGGRVESILVLSLTGVECCIRAKRFVLAGGAIENARLLLCSNSQVEEGIGNQSGWVGRNMIDHLKNMVGTFTPFSPQVYLPEAEYYFISGNAMGFDLTLNSELLLDLGLPDHAIEFARRFLPGFEDPVISVWAYCEQWPNRESRITLSEEKDELGMPIACLDWRLSDRDRADFKRFFEQVNMYLERNKIGRFTFNKGAEELDYANDSNHQMGTTRMARDSSMGVVDANCQVFGLENLFIVGTSVFPTGGNANPTFTILALARRLGDFLISEKRAGSA